jgi:hypothetical protein
MGKVKQVVYEDLEPYESVDANASVTLKEKHRIYGRLIQLLAIRVKGVLGASYKKGTWQSIWPVATKIFSCAVSGWSLETCKDMYRKLAESLTNFPMEFYDQIAKVAHDTGTEYVGMLKRKQPKEMAEVYA